MISTVVLIGCLVILAVLLIKALQVIHALKHEIRLLQIIIKKE